MTEAVSIAAELEAKPTVTRNLLMTRAWLNSNRRGTTRAGLVASASANRLRADGLEINFDFHKGYDWEHWFLDLPNDSEMDEESRYSNDIRSSSKLEVAATQFEIQGLELDWVGLCWGEDLTWNGVEWILRRFNNKLWKPIKPNDRRRLYLINAYRVLMTRARQGMVIYVPQPASEDHSRLHGDLNSTAEFLISCGATSI